MDDNQQMDKVEDININQESDVVIDCDKMGDNQDKKDINDDCKDVESAAIADNLEEHNDNDTDLTDDELELGDNIDIVYHRTNKNSMTIESDSELPENINLLPSKADTQNFADLYDPQLIVQKKRRCIDCVIL